MAKIKSVKQRGGDLDITLDDGIVITNRSEVYSLTSRIEVSTRIAKNLGKCSQYGEDCKTCVLSSSSNESGTGYLNCVVTGISKKDFFDSECSDIVMAIEIVLKSMHFRITEEWEE